MTTSGAWGPRDPGEAEGAAACDASEACRADAGEECDTESPRAASHPGLGWGATRLTGFQATTSAGIVKIHLRLSWGTSEKAEQERI